MNFKKMEIGQIPEDWYLKKIGDFSEIKHWKYSVKKEYER